MESLPILFCVLLVLTVKTELVCSRTPNVTLINSGTLTTNGTTTYNLTRELAKNVSISLTCESNRPNRWIWKDDGLAVFTVEVEKFRKEMKETLLFSSKITMTFIDDGEPLETNLTCIDEMDNERLKPRIQTGTCIRINETRPEKAPGFIAIRVDKNRSIDECLTKVRNDTRQVNCKTTIKVDMDNKKHYCDQKGTAKTIPCHDLDHCNSLIYMNVETIACRGSLQNLASTPANGLYFSTKNSSQISYCESDMSGERESWISYVLLYPSFGNPEWRKFSYHADVMEAINASSIQIFAVNREKTAKKGRLGPAPPSYNFAVNETVEFGCRAVYSLYMKGFRMKVGSTDSETIVVDGQKYFYDKSSHTHNLKQNITLDTTKYGNISWVSCDGQFWNSEKWFSTSIDISLYPVQEPSVNLTQSQLDSKSKDSFVLNCVYRGWPRPIISWNFSDLYIPINESKPNPGEDGHNLQWSQTKVITKRQGPLEVTCLARNFNGSASNSVILEALDSSEQISTKQFSSEQVIQIVVICSVVVFIITAGIIGIFYWRYRKKLVLYSQTQQLSTEEIEEFYSGAKESSTIYEALLLPYNNEYEVQRDELNLDGTILGSGQFGLVLKGSIGPLTVAVKTVKPTADVIYLRSLLSELKILQFVGTHRNIVNLIGADTSNIKNREVLLVLDYCSNGSLINFLRQCRERFVDFFGNTSNDKQQPPLYENSRDVTITSGNLILFATEIASAMEHLVSKNIIHGDLAARNVLVTEDLHAKICDFGLAKQLFHYSVYVQKINCPLPLQWMAIESLQDMEFSLASDRWSYGVTLWEIFSLAELPYPGVPWSFESYKALQEGYRMPKPAYANDSIYKIMLQCWNAQPQERPSYEYVIEELRKEVESLT